MGAQLRELTPPRELRRHLDHASGNSGRARKYAHCHHFKEPMCRPLRFVNEFHG